jgi:hypothetical protein
MRRRRIHVAVPAVGLVALVLLALAPAAAAQTPNYRGIILAAELKKSMQATYKQTVPGIRFNRVTCTLGERSATGKCQAKFVVRTRRLKGTFKVTAKVDERGGVRWQATAVTCTSLKTRKRVAC